MYRGSTGFEGVQVWQLREIEIQNGNVLHALKASDEGFPGFGEAYFSAVYGNSIKAWKLHRRMTLNLVVPVGAIRFVIHDRRPSSDTEGEFMEVVLSRNKYGRLTIGPGLWFGFQGLAEGENLLLNLADIEHDPAEADTAPVNAFDYPWK